MIQSQEEGGGSKCNKLPSFLFPHIGREEWGGVGEEEVFNKNRKAEGRGQRDTSRKESKGGKQSEISKK